MMKSMGVEQKFLLKKKLRDEERAIARRKAKMKLYMTELGYGVFVIVIAITMIILMAWVSHDRHQRWPELEPDIIAQKQKERKRIHLLELQELEQKQQKEDEEIKRQSE